MRKRRADGLLQKSFTHPATGRRVVVYGKTERELNEKMAEKLTDAKNSERFSKIADEWWNQNEARWELQTIKSYKNAYKKAVEYFGRYRVEDINIPLITKYYAMNHERAYKTLANYRTVLNQIMTYAVAKGLIAFNPVQYAQLPSGTHREKREAASEADEQRIRDSVDIWLFPYVALMTGMRKGEILALKWKDVNFETGEIYVAKSIAHNGDRPVVKEPKTSAGIRTVPLLKSLETVLRERQGNPDDYIISDNGKTPLTNRRYTTLFRHYCEETGITCTAHQLRHSFATIAFEHGVDVKAVQEILGHRQLSTTMDIYTDFRKKSFENVKNKLSDL